MALGTVMTALMGAAAVSGEVKTVNTIGFLGEGHTVEEYSANVNEMNEALDEAQRNYDSLAECGADLTMADNELSHAKIALAHATEEHNEAVEAEKKAQEEAEETAKKDAKAYDILPLSITEATVTSCMTQLAMVCIRLHIGLSSSTF